MFKFYAHFIANNSDLTCMLTTQEIRHMDTMLDQCWVCRVYWEQIINYYIVAFGV